MSKITTSFEFAAYDSVRLRVTDGDFSYEQIVASDVPIGMVVTRTLQMFFHERAKHELAAYTGRFIPP